MIDGGLTRDAAEALLSPQQRARMDSVQLFLAHWRAMLVALSLVTVTVMVAWRDDVPLSARAAWGGAALLDYAGQGLICFRMERSESPAEAMTQWMPWLLLAIAVSGTLWALVPWLIPDASAQVLLFACLFSASMLFCVANSPGTPAMLISGAIPIALLDTLILLRNVELRYTGVGFPMLIGLIVLYGLRGQTVLRAGMVARHTSEDLARELEINQRRLVEVEHERTLLLERERLTRDMHDGLGSALVGSLVEVERGEVDPRRLAAMLRECVDDLRSVIDSLEPIDHDLVALLSNLRHRLERRLEAAGLVLEWEMRDLPPSAWLGPPEALHLMRLVQEVLSNVIKHAAASRIRVVTRAQGGDIALTIADDGIGFDPAAKFNGRGMPSLKRRAALLGGSIHVDSEPGRGTRVVLRLPVKKIEKGA